MIELHDIKLKWNDPRELLFARAAAILHVREEDITDLRILKRSLDARRKPELSYVYSVVLDVRKGVRVRTNKHNKIMFTQLEKYRIPESGTESLHERPVVVGAGPAGLFCAYLLAVRGYRPLILEQGERVEDREKRVEAFFRDGTLSKWSNVQFGEGGAGTFSDGKLTTSVRDESGRNGYILQTFVRFGAPEEILFDQKPHLGTDRLTGILSSIRHEIERLGGTYRFGCRVTDLESDASGIRCVIINDAERIDTGCAVFAIGHSSRETFRMLRKRGLYLEPKPFAVGVRAEHPQHMIDLSQYGLSDPHLPPAVYRLASRSGDRSVYTFCMCPGGYVVNASSEEGRLCVNGMSYYSRSSENANSAVVAAVRPEDAAAFCALFGRAADDPFSGLAFQELLEENAFQTARGAVPVQLYEDFAAGRNSAGFGEVKPLIRGAFEFGRVDRIFPDAIRTCLAEGIRMFGAKLKGYDRPDAVLSGVESRTSSPVRIRRGADLVSDVGGVYPCGEGAGYAGGIMSAAMDGMRTAEAIIRRFRPLKADRAE